MNKTRNLFFAVTALALGLSNVSNAQNAPAFNVWQDGCYARFQNNLPGVETINYAVLILKYDARLRRETEWWVQRQVVLEGYQRGCENIGPNLRAVRWEQWSYCPPPPPPLPLPPAPLTNPFTGNYVGTYKGSYQSGTFSLQVGVDNVLMGFLTDRNGNTTAITSGSVDASGYASFSVGGETFSGTLSSFGGSVQGSFRETDGSGQDIVMTLSSW